MTQKLDPMLPSPIEVARQLEGCLNQEQAESMAEYVYQPFRELLKSYKTLIEARISGKEGV